MIRGCSIFFISLLLARVPSIYSSTFLLPLGDDCRTVNFELGPEDPDNFSGAIFRVDDGGDIGTAFLVDSINGYLLTAKHVVKKTIADKSLKIIASTPALPGAKFELLIVDSTPDEQDLALLRIKEPGKTPRITPLDIGLRPPVHGSKLWAMGYPTTYGDEVNTSLRVQPDVKVMSSPSEDGLIEVSQVAIGGSSGGPLVDSSGRAVGICRKEVGVGDAVARYAPMSDAEVLLNELPQHAVVDTLDSGVIKRSMSPQELTSALKRGPGNASNMELYTWARHILGTRANYKESSDYLNCPIARAMMHRQLDDAVFWLGPLSSRNDFATVSLTIAEREISLDHPQEALDIISPVASDLSGSPDLSLQIRFLLVQATSIAKLGRGDDAMALLTSKAESFPPDSEFRAAITGETARVYALQHGALSNGADDPMRWFNEAMGLYSKAESSIKKFGPSKKLAEIYMDEARLLAKHMDFHESLDKFELARETYREIGDFRGQSEVLFSMAEVADGFDASKAAQYGNEYLALDPAGPDAGAVTALLLKAGARPQDLPGLHVSGKDWLITTTQDVDHGDYVYVPNPPCAQNMTLLVNNLNERLRQFAGPAISQFAGPLASVAKGSSVSAVERLLGSGVEEPKAQCQMVCAVYPKDAEVTSVELWAGEQNQPVRKCSFDKNGEFPCEIGWSKWLKP